MKQIGLNVRCGTCDYGRTPESGSRVDLQGIRKVECIYFPEPAPKLATDVCGQHPAFWEDAPDNETLCNCLRKTSPELALAEAWAIAVPDPDKTIYVRDIPIATLFRGSLWAGHDAHLHFRAASSVVDMDTGLAFINLEGRTVYRYQPMKLTATPVETERRGGV